MSTVEKRKRGNTMIKLVWCVKVKKPRSEEPPWLSRLKKNIIGDNNIVQTTLNKDIRRRLMNGENPRKLLKQLTDVIV